MELMKGNLGWILPVGIVLLILMIVLLFFWDTLKRLWSGERSGRREEPDRKRFPTITPRDLYTPAGERQPEPLPAREPAWESPQYMRAAQADRAPSTAPAFQSGETTEQILASLRAIEKSLEEVKQHFETQGAAGSGQPAVFRYPSGALSGPVVEIRVNVSRPEDVALNRSAGATTEPQPVYVPPRDLAPEIVEQFNASPHPETALEQYHPKRLGVVNQAEIRTKPWATPQFGFADDGACLFFKIDEDRGYVVPRPRRLYSADSHKFDGLKDLFDSNFQEQYEYWKTSLARPAIVRRTGNYWVVEAKGQLELAFR